jgi:hypothetical protein
MELQSNGYERNLFDGFWPHSYKHRAIKNDEFVWDKKLSVYYRVASRFKNNSRPYTDANTESLYLEIDSNLSRDLNFVYVDTSTWKSIVINLLEVDQGHFGDTKLRISTQYINEKQEIFENDGFFMCKSIGGTIGKRLQHYKQRFDEECNKRLGDFLVNGFEVHRSHVINNLAAYIYTESKKQKPRVAVFDTSPTSQINNWLIVFSILNNDCFFMHCLSPESTCTRYGYPWENYQKRHSELTPVRLPIEQVEIFEKIFGLSGLDKYAIEQAIDNFTSKSWDGDQFSYYKFKQWFLENIKI